MSHEQSLKAALDAAHHEAEKVIALKRELAAVKERANSIESAAQNLIEQKGRHNTELAYKRLVEALEKSK